MQSKTGSATVPVALFGVSPNSLWGKMRLTVRWAPGRWEQLVGEMPTRDALASEVL